MLYQHKTQSKATLLRRSLAMFVGFFGSMARNQAHSAQLDNLTDRHLEELGLRRTGDRTYRSF